MKILVSWLREFVDVPGAPESIAARARPFNPELEFRFAKSGDSFAGGFVGYLARHGTVDDSALRRAVLHGTVCASFAVEAFSVDGIAAATPDALDARYRALCDLIAL